MSTGTIGTLKVVLGGDTSGLDKSLKDSQSSLASFGSKIGLGFAALAAAAAGATVAIGMAVKSAIDSADGINKMAQSTGMSTEELSKLKYAADLADVSSQTLGKSMVKLSQAMVSAGTDAAGQAGRSFAAMGVQVKNQNGTLRDTSEVVKDVADKFQWYRDGADKVALATALFGKAGKDLIPLLNGGRIGLEEAGAEAKRYGIVLDTKTTIAAQAFNDNLKKMDAIKQGLITTMTAKMLPALEALSDRFLKSREESGLLSTVGDALASMFNKLAAGALALMTTWDRVFATAVNLKTAFGQMTAGNFSGAMETMRQSAADTAAALGKLKEEVVNVVSKDPSETWSSEAVALKNLSREVNGYFEAWKKNAPSVGDAAAEAKKNFDKFLESQQKAIAGQRAEFEATGMATGAKERLKTVLQALAIQKATDLVLTDQQRIKMTETANAAELMGLKLGNLALIGAANPLASIALQIDATTAKLQSGSLAAQDYAVLSGQAAQLTQKFWADSATSVGGSFESIGASMAQLNDGWARMAKVGQAFGATIAFVNAYVAASEAFAKTPFPGNIAIAAGVLAKGMMMVASIKSAAVPKYADGGLISGPGSGVSDSITARVSNGEYIMPAAATRQYMPELEAMRSGNFGGRSGGQVTINVAGLGRSSYSREDVRQIIGGINEMVADGYQLNVQPA